MYLYRVTLNRNIGYDMYDSAVVIASSEEEARHVHPDGYAHWDGGESKWVNGRYSSNNTWGTPDQLTVERIGTAAAEMGEDSKVVVSSFNAG